MKESEKKEILHDVHDFMELVEAHPDKSYSLSIHARQGKLCGSGVEINKPAGKDVRLRGV